MMEPDNIILNEASQAQRPKTRYSLSYVEYKPNTNAAIVWNTVHTKGKSHMGQVG
jgi:hypothetical protein